MTKARILKSRLLIPDTFLPLLEKLLSQCELTITIQSCSPAPLNYARLPAKRLSSLTVNKQATPAFPSNSLSLPALCLARPSNRPRRPAASERAEAQSLASPGIRLHCLNRIQGTELRQPDGRTSTGTPRESTYSLNRAKIQIKEGGKDRVLGRIAVF